MIQSARNLNIAPQFSAIYVKKFSSSTGEPQWYEMPSSTYEGKRREVDFPIVENDYSRNSEKNLALIVRGNEGNKEPITEWDESDEPQETKKGSSIEEIAPLVRPVVLTGDDATIYNDQSVHARLAWLSKLLGFKTVEIEPKRSVQELNISA